MRGFLRRHWLALAGATPLVLEASRWGETLLKWGEHSEFVLHRVEDLKMAWNTLIAAPPQWVNIPLMISGLILIWLDVLRSRRRKTEDVKDAAEATTTQRKGEELQTAFKTALDAEEKQRFDSYKYLEGLITKTENAVEKIKKETADLKERDNKLAYRIESNDKQADLKFGMVSTAIRARDALAILTKADETIVPLGEKLIAARESDYPDWKAWNTEYAAWNAAFREIDAELNKWPNWGNEPPYLDVNERDYERASNIMPPIHIRSDVIDMNRSYKKVWLIQPRWLKDHEEMLKWLKDKADTLPR